MSLSVCRILTNPHILGYCQYSQQEPADSSYTELLIGRVALTSFNWRAYWVVCIGAYSSNNLRLGYDLGSGLGLESRLGCGAWYMDAQMAATFGSTDPYCK